MPYFANVSCTEYKKRQSNLTACEQEPPVTEAGGRTTTVGMPAEASVLPARRAEVAERSTIIQSYTVFSRLSVEKPCRFADLTDEITLSDC